MSDQENNEHSLQDDRPPRSKARLAFIVALWLVIILLLIAIFSPVRDVVINRFLTVAPPPTPTIVPGGNQFYIQAFPQGTITIDGQAITSLTNQYNGASPITLARGVHKIVWQAPPFLPLTCIVYVPPISSEPCNYESLGDIANAPSLRVISFNASMSNLSNTQQTALKQAIQATLNTLQSTDTVLAGEQYVYAQPSGLTIVKTAIQPLNATLSLHLDANPNTNNSCTEISDECNLSGQNCLQICSGSGTTSPDGTFIWNINVLYYPTWTYTTQSGQVVARNQPDTNSPLVDTDHSIDLQVTWDGKTWHVGLPSYKNVLLSLYNTIPPACGSIHSLTSTNSNYGSGSIPFSVTQGGNPTPVSWGFVVGPNEAQGCLGVVVPSPNTTTTPTDFKQLPAYFLYRFGVLLAVNALAHSEFPNIPMADANEQAIAQSIAAKLKY